MALTRLVNDYKDSVKVASTGANIDLGAAPNTLDGVSLAANDRILVKDQSPSYLNGIYRVTTLGTGSNGSWSRSSDFNDWREISPGAMVFVEAGSINGNAFYFINGGGSNVTINTTEINFSNLYSVNGNITSFPGNVNIAGTLNVTGNIVTKSYETVTLTEYANVQNVAGNINVTNGGNINIGDGGNIYMGSTALPRFRTGNTAPESPNLGDTWYQGNTDILYEYIQDANNNKYWFDLSSNPSSYGNLTVANTLTLNGNTNNYGTANLGSVSQVIITGGTSGYVLRTDGNGGLSWVAVSATAGGSNSFVQFNDGGSLGGSTYLQYNKTSGNLVSNSTTAATSTTTGAIVVSGGIGVGGNVKADIVHASNNGNGTNFQVGDDVWLGDINVANTMRIMGQQDNTQGYIVFGSTNASTYIGRSGSGALTVTGNFATTGTINSSGNIVAASATTSTSKTTGAMVVSGTGGVGVGGNVFANAFYADYHLFANGTTITTPAGGSNTMVQFNDGSNFNGATFLQYNKTSGNLVSNSTTAATSTTTGAFVLSGGAAIGGALYANNFNGTAVYAGTIGNTSATFTGASATLSGALTLGGALNGQTINGTSILGTTIGNTASAVNGNLVTASAVYAGTIGNTGTTIYGTTTRAIANVSAYYANAASGLTLGIWPTASQYYGLFNNLGNPANSEYIILSGTTDPSTYISSRYGGSTIIRGNNNSSAYQLSINNTGMLVSGGLAPASNNAVTLGTASAYWSTVYGVSFVGTSTTAKYADLAEMYHADDYYAPGTVMVFGGDLDVTNSKISHDPRVAGIVSTNPAYLMNDNFEHDNWLPIALTGRVPCLVQGPVQKGDLLVTGNHDGVAQKLDKSKYEVGCIIGKSLDIITDDSIRKIEVAVGRY